MARSMKPPSSFEPYHDAGPVECTSSPTGQNQTEAERDVAKYGIRADEVILVSRFDQKADVIRERGISVYVDDQDEMLMHIPENVTVLKSRNGGNYEF